jgi:hypothetical protein
MPSLVRLLAQVRVRLARSPWLYWALVGCAALVVWWVVVDATAALERERARWGATRTVLVVSADTAAGDRLVVQSRDYPTAMVPTAAINSEMPPPEGARASHDLVAGTVLTAVDVATADAIPNGWVVLAIDPEQQPPLVPGHDVAVLAAGQHWCDGTVHEIDPLQIAIPVDCAAAVSDLSTVGAVTLGRAPEPPSAQRP